MKIRSRPEREREREQNNMTKCSKCEKRINLFTYPVGRTNSLCSECFAKENNPNNMVSAQEYLNQKYPNKEGVKSIVFESNYQATQSGDLLIADFPNLIKILLDNRAKLSIAKLEIRNCPQLSCLKVRNQINELVTDNLPNLTELYLLNSNLTFFDISKYPKLLRLNCESNSNLTPPLQTLLQKIQTQEKENQTKITHLEQELQS